MRKKFELLQYKDKVFGRLKVIADMGVFRGYRRIKCLCECGKETEVNLFALKSGCTKSCGCLSTERKKNNKGPSNHRWSGYEFVSGTLMNSFRFGAKERGLDFLISPKYLHDLFLVQNGKCALTGADLTFNSDWTKWDGNASIDRIDSSKDYIEGNVQWVTKIINKMKSDLSQEEFIKTCQLVAKFNHF